MTTVKLSFLSFFLSFFHSMCVFVCLCAHTLVSMPSETKDTAVLSGTSRLLSSSSTSRCEIQMFIATTCTTDQSTHCGLCCGWTGSSVHAPQCSAPGDWHSITARHFDCVYFLYAAEEACGRFWWNPSCTCLHSEALWSSWGLKPSPQCRVTDMLTAGTHVSVSLLTFDSHTWLRNTCACWVGQFEVQVFTLLLYNLNMWFLRKQVQ